MQDVEIRILPETGGLDNHVEGYTVEFYEEGGTCVAVALHDLSGTDFEPGNLVDRAKAVIREVLKATGKAGMGPDGGPRASHSPDQPEGPPISSSQSEPRLDDAPTVRVKGEGMIRPD